MLRVEARCYKPLINPLSLELDGDEASIMGNLIWQGWFAGKLMMPGSGDSATIRVRDEAALKLCTDILDGVPVEIGDHKLQRIQGDWVKADGKDVRLR